MTTFYITTDSIDYYWIIQAEDEWSMFAIWDAMGLPSYGEGGRFYSRKDNKKLEGKTRWVRNKKQIQSERP